MSSSPFRQPTLLSELKRRHVFRVTAAYVVAAFAVIQAADLMLPRLGLPDWTVTLVLVLCILGLPVALALAWAFDWTPRGVVRTAELADAGAEPSVSRQEPVRAGQIAVVGAVIILAFAGGAFALFRDPGPALEEKRVVVAPFENRTGDPSLDPISNMAADWITQGLSQTGTVDVVPSTAALKSFRYVQENALAGRDPLRALAEETGARLVVAGSYYRHGDSIQFQAEITDARRGKLLRTISPASGPLSRPTEAIEVLRQRTLAGLAPVIDPRLGSYAQVTSQPPSYQAYREHAEGNEFFVGGNWRKAVEHFQRAVALDSSYTLPLLYMAVSYSNLGEYAVADSIIRRLDRSRESLAPYDRALLDMVNGWLNGDAAAAYEATKRAAEFAPGTLPHVQWGLEAVRLNRPREALQVFSQIDPRRGDVRGWAPYWIYLGTAHHLLGQHGQELKEMRRARALYPDDPQYVLFESRALAALGRVAELNRLIDTRLVMAEEKRPTPGWLMLDAAQELRAHGHLEAAGQVIDRALTWYRTRPPEEQTTVQYRFQLAYTLLNAERWEQAQVLFSELSAEDASNVEYLGNLGVLAARLGNPAEAERISAQLAAFQTPYLRGWNTAWRACIAAVLGDKEQAVLLLQQALSQGDWFGVHLHSDPDLEPLKDYPPFKEFLRPKG